MLKRNCQRKTDRSEESKRQKRRSGGRLLYLDVCAIVSAGIHCPWGGDGWMDTESATCMNLGSGSRVILCGTHIFSHWIATGLRCARCDL